MPSREFVPILSGLAQLNRLPAILATGNFRNAHDLRELSLEDHCFEVETNAFAGVEKCDFLNIKGACLIEANAFQNSSRIYSLNIVDSSLDLQRDTFARLYHVNQVRLFL